MRLMIIGAGKYGLEMEDVALQTGKYSTICFLDDSAASVKVMGKCADFTDFVDDKTDFFVAFGDNELRARWLETLKQHGINPATIIHPTAYVSPTAAVGRGVSILPHAIVNSYTVIKEGCMINSGAIVDHDCVVDEYVHVCVGAIVRADNHLPSKTKIEAGVVVERFTYR